MKIRWIGDRKNVPPIGIMERDQTAIVSTALGEALIKEHRAEEVVDKKKEKSKKIGGDK